MAWADLSLLSLTSRMGGLLAALTEVAAALGEDVFVAWQQMEEQRFCGWRNGGGWRRRFSTSCEDVCWVVWKWEVAIF